MIESGRRRLAALALATATTLVLTGWALDTSGAPAQSTRARSATTFFEDSRGCIHCHDGIEDMHPEAALSCVDCHGGNGESMEKLVAHVRPSREDPGDERVAPEKEDLAWRRFHNPMDLRVAERTCGQCHDDVVKHVKTSIHGTTAGHLSDGFYEMGLNKKKESPYGVFPVASYEAEPGDIESLVQIPEFRGHGSRDELKTHYVDLARKECMQCHLWSEGRSVRGRVGFDGDYRGEGCAACHVPYAVDGLSETGDQRLSKTEPGHPRFHRMTRAPTTSSCTTCHYGDASIGLHFRGLSQLPPGAPGGPDIPGTTDALLNRVFYINDPAMTPPDVHHERGMHCIDCHTASDVMGDGKLYGAMEHAVEISCADCHGTFTEKATLRTERGTPLEHLRWVGDEVVLTSKVDGIEHPVPQASDVVDPDSEAFNPHASEAMTQAHANVECYTCHAGWNVNFLGFHFDRNESLSQLDLISGRRTPGRVTTQEKVFATWKSFYAGLNESGRVAPYLTGFSTMGTVRDEDGEVVIDQAMPETAAGLSGMTMVHHQLHSTRPTARSCVECHRTSTTWGLGSINFRLTRQMAFVADRRGIEVVALNRGQLSASVPVAKVVQPDVVDMVIDGDKIQGHARTLYATEGGRGVHVFDVSAPTHPKRLAFTASINPRGLALAGDHLYLADGIGGLRIYDVSDPEEIEQVGQLPMFDAHSVHVQWPYAYVADGPGGLSIVDIREPRAPRAVGGSRLSHNPRTRDAAVDVSLLFQYSRPVDPEFPELGRSTARNLCVLIDENEGLSLIDVTEPTHPKLLFPRPSGNTRARARDNLLYTGLAVQSHVDLAEPQGGSRTRENDYAYLLVEQTLGNGQRLSRMAVVDITDPVNPARRALPIVGAATEMMVPAALYNPPFLQRVMLVPGQGGVLATDVSVSAEPKQLGAFAAIQQSYVVAVEEFPLDKMLDEAGRPLKDVSHAHSRWLQLPEVERMLDVPGYVLGTVEPGEERPEIPGVTARLHLQHNDQDRSGLLEDEEMRGSESTDLNRDGRITLSELAGFAGLHGAVDETTAVEPEMAPRFLETRVDPEGDLSRLLDGINPFEFDEDDDRRLDRREMTRAFFAALDLDGDRRLDYDELSRHPGELRQLRYRGPRERKLFEKVDGNNDGTVVLREFRLHDDDWAALDINRDDQVELGQLRNRFWELRGFVGPRTEWPTRRYAASALPPMISVQRVLEIFDRDGNEKLSMREVRKRPELWFELDQDGDEVVTMQEIQNRVDLVTAAGVEVTHDHFEGRWDLDGDGKVEPEELPPGTDLAVLRGEGR